MPIPEVHRRQPAAVGHTVAHHDLWLRCLLLLNFSSWLVPVALAADQVLPVQTATKDLARCLPDNSAFLRAHLSGAINAELSWSGDSLSCAGSVRPNAEGIRVRFSSVSQHGEHTLALLFGITGLKESESGHALPVNLTIMREGTGEFYGTQGDNKCTADEIHQEPVSGIPLRQRAYRVIARGFCTQPARALNDSGAVLVTRFDFAGRVDFYSDDAPAATTTPNAPTSL